MARKYYHRKKQFVLKTWEIILLLVGSIIFFVSGGTLFNLVSQYRNSALTVIFISGIFISTLILSIGIYVENKRRAIRRSLTQSEVDKMSGIEFENYVADLLRSQGYSVSVTPPSNDYGADLVAKNSEGSLAVQVKRYGPRKKVGRWAVSDALGGIHHYKTSGAMVVTNSYFTKNAKYMAKTTDTKLIDRSTLARWIHEYQNS